MYLQTTMLHQNTGSHLTWGVIVKTTPQTNSGDRHPTVAAKAATQTIKPKGLKLDHTQPNIGSYPKYVNSYLVFNLKVRLMLPQLSLDRRQTHRP